MTNAAGNSPMPVPVVQRVAFTGQVLVTVAVLVQHQRKLVMIPVDPAIENGHRHPARFHFCRHPVERQITLI